MRAGDGAFLLSCIRALAESHGLLEHVTATAEALEQAILAEPLHSGCEIAECDGIAAGYALWHRSFSSFAAKPMMYLEDMAVLPEFRRRGIARALLKRVGEICLSRGLGEAYWHVMEWNDGARRLYDAAGAKTGTDAFRVYWTAPAMARFVEEQ